MLEIDEKPIIDKMFKETQEKLDKDRFRRDMGQVVESYEIVAERLGINIPK